MSKAKSIALTSKARNHIERLLAERDKQGHGLRVFVSGGGCSGMQYGMTIEPKSRALDTVVEDNGINVFIDPTSLMHMDGASIDYEETLMGGGFRIDNPQAVTSCGCGHSFRTSDSQGSTDKACC